MKKYIGITLVFSSKEEKYCKAVKSSYIFKLKDWSDLKSDIVKLAAKQIKSEFKGFKYLGISDLYISEKEGENNYLGRTSFFNDKTYMDAEKHTLKNKVKLLDAFTKSQLFNKSNISLVYFHQDKEDKQFNSTFIIYSQVSKSKDLEHIIKLAKSNLFKQKIINFSVEKLYLRRVKFVGINYLYGIKGKGLFKESGKFKNYSKIKSELLNDKEIITKLKAIKRDYKYVI